MPPFLAEIFIWWQGQTWGTRLDTWQHGEFVGTDDAGNRYFRSKPGAKKQNRRWVLYNGYAEASAIPPGWHGWMHHRTDVPPTEDNYKPWPWEKGHLSNRTGSAEAYRPDGSLLNKGERPRVTGDYDAWSPE
jgi:NADH:ubiquinone oxidoreductase subunit